MAKKNTKDFSFSDLSSLINTSMEKTSIKIDTNEDVNEYISTGIYMLDALLSCSVLNGGISTNRITVFAGESGVGKSYLCYNIAREAQKKGYTVMYIDTEFAIERNQLPNFGIDISENKFILIRNNVIEDLKIFLTKFLNGVKEKVENGSELPKIIIFLDSVGQLASRKEVEDALEGKEKADMTRSKALASLFRIINSDLGYLNIPMICTNHTYKTMDMFPRDIMKGGNGLYYSASTIVFLSKSKLQTGNEDELDLGGSGIIVTAKAVKNRKAKPKKIKFEIDFKKGSVPSVGAEYFCTEKNFNTLGIAQGKYEIDKNTGSMVFKPGGNKWFIKHLNKSVYTKELHSPLIFNQEVKTALDKITIDYFSYTSFSEIEEYENMDPNALLTEDNLISDLSDLDLDL